MKRILLLSCFFVLFPVQAMEVEMEDDNHGCVSEGIDNFNEQIETTDYSEHNINGGNACIVGDVYFVLHQ